MLGIGRGRQSSFNGMAKGFRKSGDGRRTGSRPPKERHYRLNIAKNAKILKWKDSDCSKSIECADRKHSTAFYDLQQSLNQEEQRIRTANTQKKDRISADYHSRVATVELELAAAQKRVTPALNDLSEKLRAELKQSFALKWQAAKHSSDGQRYAALRFRDYLGKIVSG